MARALVTRDCSFVIHDCKDDWLLNSVFQLLVARARQKQGVPQSHGRQHMNVKRVGQIFEFWSKRGCDWLLYPVPPSKKLGSSKSRNVPPGKRKSNK